MYTFWTELKTNGITTSSRLHASAFNLFCLEPVLKSRAWKNPHYISRHNEYNLFECFLFFLMSMYRSFRVRTVCLGFSILFQLQELGHVFQTYGASVDPVLLSILLWDKSIIRNINNKSTKRALTSANADHSPSPAGASLQFSGI